MFKRLRWVEIRSLQKTSWVTETHNVSISGYQICHQHNLSSLLDLVRLFYISSVDDLEL